MPILRHIDFNPPDWGEFGGAPPRVDRAHYQAVLADRPRAFWPLDDAPGTPLLRDAQRHGHDATAVGGVTSGAFAGPHIHDPGDCVDFSGGRLELATLASFGSQLSEGFTFACWLRTSITQSATLLSAVNPNLGTALVFQLNRTGLGNNLPGYIRLIIRDNNGRNLRADLDAAGAVIDNQWHHVAVSYDATTEEVAFYIDGASQSTNYEGQDAPIVTTDFTVPFAIGASSASNGFSNPFIGQLSHASLYDTPLTTSSIAAHTVAGTGPVSAALTQSETAAYPDSPGGPPLGLQGTLGTGNAGVYQSVSLPPSIESTYSRIVIATEALTTGSATMIRAVDTEERPLTWVRLANDQTLTLQTNNGPSTSVELPTSLPWHTIEIAIHASSSTAELRVDGWLAATLPTPAGVSTHRIDVGLMDCRDAAGIIDLDEWVTADTLIGPPVVASTGEFADDPTRWLILYNRNDPDSIAWVEAYRQARGVPLGNLYGVSTSNAEIVDSSTYDQLRAAIDARLAQGTLDQQLIGVLLGPGLPGLVDVDGDATRAWPVVAGLQTNTPATQLTDNPLGVDTPERPTTTNLNGRLLASRIDGDTALSKDLIARSLTVSTSSFDQSN
ncbi:MAG: LamG-like jellyroll fold domain-containing protein, partial [Planctomycetota bacterium]